MWLLADGLVPFSDSVCAFLGNTLSLFVSKFNLYFLDHSLQLEQDRTAFEGAVTTFFRMPWRIRLGK